MKQIEVKTPQHEDTEFCSDRDLGNMVKGTIIYFNPENWVNDRASMEIGDGCFKVNEIGWFKLVPTSVGFECKSADGQWRDDYVLSEVYPIGKSWTSTAYDISRDAAIPELAAALMICMTV